MRTWFLFSSKDVFIVNLLHWRLAHTFLPWYVFVAATFNFLFMGAYSLYEVVCACNIVEVLFFAK